MKPSTILAIKAAIKGRSFLNQNKDAAPFYFRCVATGISMEKRFAFIVDRVNKRGKVTRQLIGAFYSLPVMFRFLRETLDAEHFQDAAAYEAHVYQQPNVPDCAPINKIIENTGLVLDDPDQRSWIEAPYAQTWTEYVAARKPRKAKKKDDTPLKALAKKAKKQKPKQLIIGGNQCVIVRATANVDTALVPVTDFKKQAGKRRALAKTAHDVRKFDDFVLYEYATAGKGKANPWFPGAVGDVMITTPKRVKLAFNN